MTEGVSVTRERMGVSRVRDLRPIGVIQSLESPAIEHTRRASTEEQLGGEVRA